MIKLIYKFTCDGCAEKGILTTKEISFPFYKGEKPFIMYCPEEWREFNGKIYCEKHEIVITIDKEPMRIE